MFFTTNICRDMFLKSFVKSVGNTSGMLLTILLGWHTIKFSRKVLSFNSSVHQELEEHNSEYVNNFLSDSVVREEIKNFKVLFDKL